MIAPPKGVSSWWLLGTYTSRFNRRHSLTGHLFGGRYKALLVDGSGNGYLKTVCDYVHLNPARAGLIPLDQPLRRYPWSSWPEYLKPPAQRWVSLRVDRLFGEHGITQDCAAGRRRLEESLEARRQSEAEPNYRPIRRGWCFGGDSFRNEALQRMAGQIGAEHYGAERSEADQVKAERIVTEELTHRGWAEADLARLAKGHLAKIEIAARLRAETLRTVKWIAARLRMGAPSYLNNRLHRWRKGVLAVDRRRVADTKN